MGLIGCWRATPKPLPAAGRLGPAGDRVGGGARAGSLQRRSFDRRASERIRWSRDSGRREGAGLHAERSRRAGGLVELVSRTGGDARLLAGGAALWTWGGLSA